ncbi:MAG: metallophosphoesterase [Dinghuibacter sp.]|nr:metallophosphoesterase [Dinghuibacter sp.]
MKIQYCSDLHIEFKLNWEYLSQFRLQPEGEILLLAGDIVPFSVMNRYNDFFNYLSDNFEQVCWIPGNHEYYHFDLADKQDPLCEKIRSNITLLNNTTFTYKQVNFLCTTMWSKIKPQHEVEVQLGVSDFFLIKNNEARLTAQKFNEMHQAGLAYLEQALHTHAGETNFIMTHHVPTMLRYPVYFRHSPINDAFAVELHDFIEQTNARYWLYGHHHCPVKDFTIGNTVMITNQLGYVKENQHKHFRTGAVVEC